MAERYSPTYTVPNASGVGDSILEGSDPRLPRPDHRHGREAYGTPVAVISDAAASAGTGTNVVRANHQHGITTATAIPAAVTATGSAGASGGAPSRDQHIHALGIVTTRGDMIIRDISGPARLALGTNSQVIQSNGTDIVWGSAPTPTFISMAKWYTD